MFYEKRIAFYEFPNIFVKLISGFDREVVKPKGNKNEDLIDNDA
jgi:hypothetical protein